MDTGSVAPINPLSRYFLLLRFTVWYGELAGRCDLMGYVDKNTGDKRTTKAPKSLWFAMLRDRTALKNFRWNGLIGKGSRKVPLSRYLVLFIGIATLCCGCFRTNLPQAPHSSHLPRLIKLAEQQIPLVVRNEFDKQVLGHQYLLLFPMARIYTPHLAELLVQRLSLQAGFNKYGLLYQPNTVLSIPRLEITIQKAGLNGFDLFAIRRPSASLMVKATYFKPDSSVRECTSIQGHAEFRAFAFSDELQEILETTIDMTVQHLIDCLGFSNPALPYPDSFPHEMH